MYVQGAHQFFEILNFNDTQFTAHAKFKSKIERLSTQLIQMGVDC